MPVRRREVTPEAYRRVTLVALVALVFIVVTGASVRLTGSGLGCPDWPTCDGSRVVSEFRDTPEIIEFVNRMITFAVSVAVAAAVLGSRWRTPRRRDLDLLSWGLVAGVLAQIVLGGVTVLMELNPIPVMGHFLLSMVLVADAVVLHHRAGEPDDGRRVPTEAPSTVLAGWAMVGMTVLVMVFGTIVTGTGPHGGDPEVERLDFAITEVVRAHSVLGVAAHRPAAGRDGPHPPRLARAPRRGRPDDDRLRPVRQRRARAAGRAPRARSHPGVDRRAPPPPVALAGRTRIDRGPGPRRGPHVSSTSPLEVEVPDDVEVTDPDRPWIVLVWNDPINLMSYVTYVFQKLFGYSVEKATELMLDVHEKGRAVVSSGTREKAELDVFRLHEHGLWATMQHEDA